MLEKAKENYIQKRLKEIKISESPALEDTKKEIYLHQIKEEKTWAIKGLEEEVQDYNEVLEEQEELKGDLIDLREDYLENATSKMKSNFVEFLEEYNRINTQIFDSLTPSIDRVKLEIDEKFEKMGRPELQTKKLTAEQIIKFSEEMITASQSGEHDEDDIHVNEISSLKNQFRFITKNMKTNMSKNLGGFFQNIFGSSESEKLEAFLAKLKEGVPVNDPEVKIFCEQMDKPDLRNQAIATYEEQAADKENWKISKNGTLIFWKLFLMKATPNRDWINIARLILATQQIEVNCANATGNFMFDVVNEFKDHFVLKVEEFWIGSLFYIVQTNM